MSEFSYRDLRCERAELPDLLRDLPSVVSMDSTSMLFCKQHGLFRIFSSCLQILMRVSISIAVHLSGLHCGWQRRYLCTDATRTNIASGDLSSRLQELFKLKPKPIRHEFPLRPVTSQMLCLIGVRLKDLANAL